MRMHRGGVAIALVASCLVVDGPSGRDARASAPDEVRSAAVDGYVYAYPLVTMDMARRISTNVAKPEGTRAPMGQLARLREYPNAKFRDVTAPNADTLYTFLWVDVGVEPVVISVPPMKGRYYLLPMLDGWTSDARASGSLGPAGRTWRPRAGYGV